MDTLQDIIAGTRTKKVNSYNMDLFKSDIEVVEPTSIKSNYSDIVVIDKSDKSTERFGKNIVTTAVGQTDEQVFIINLKETVYNGEPQISATAQELTLNGFWYFTKNQEVDDIIHLADNFLNQNGINAKYKDILAIMELKTEFNVLQYEYETDKDKVWITADINGHLKKVTRKPHQQKAHTQSSTSIAEQLLGL